MRLGIVLLAFCCFLCVGFADLTQQQCRDAEYGRICALQSAPEVSKIVGDRLFVGTEDYLQVFSLPAAEESFLQHSQAVNLSSSSGEIDFCTGLGGGRLGNPEEDCKNFIRTIESFMEGEEILVCGTNAHHPECTVHQLDNPSNYRKLSAPDETDPGYSPFSNTHSIDAVLADNNRFFSATRFSATRPTAIQMSPGILQNDTAFTVSTGPNNHWLNTPRMVSVHEQGDYIYFFLAEPALELDGVQEIVYSRAVRICKTDIGTGNSDPKLFLTFQKARMICSVEGEEGSIPFYYDDLASTFLGQSADGNPLLYGVFNSQENGPAGGAICRFSFDPALDGSISSVFNDKNYLVSENDDGRTVWVKSPVTEAFSCPGSGVQRPSEEIEMYHLKFDSITPTNDEPLLTSGAFFLDKVTAETIRYNGDTQEVLYYTNENGDIMQAVLSSLNSGREYRHVILKSAEQSPVRDLILHNRTDNQRSLIASFDNSVKEIRRGQCSRYTDCFSCFDSKDVYCAWDVNSMRCLNKLSTSAPSASLIEPFSASEADVANTCGNRQPTIAPTTDTDTVVPCPPKLPTKTSPNEITTNTESPNDEEGKEEGEDCSTAPITMGTGTKDTPSTDGLKGDGESVISIPVVVGVSLGAFVFGLSIGSVLCIAFYIRSTIVAKAGKKDPSPEAASTVPDSGPNSTPPTIRNEMITMSQVKNNQTTLEKENMQTSEKKDITADSIKTRAPPSSRYIEHPLPNGGTVKPPKPVPSAKPVLPSSPTKINEPLGSTNSLPQIPLVKHSNGTINRHQISEEEEDSAFDTLPPLKIFPSPVPMYGSLGRNKTKSNGVARKQVPGKVPRGRTDSTTWLRQRSESLSSDISSSTSPLQSPISDV